MGFSPRETGAMSLWQFNACFDAYAAAHGGKRELDDKTFDELAAMVDKAMEESA